jgi:arylformamidase
MESSIGASHFIRDHAKHAGGGNVQFPDGHKQGFDQMSAQTPADIAYQNAAFIPDGDGYRSRWATAAAAFRATAKGALDIPYGRGPVHHLDLFLPAATPNGLMMFIHGGYWMAMGREYFSHLAAGALTRGWAVAMPSYTLAPAARIADMTDEVMQALHVAKARVSGPVVVTGHSAGGHLAARLACAGMASPARVIPISPLADLAPLMETGMNATLRIDAAEAAQESPARLPRDPACDVHIWVGGQERPAFLWHARLLAENWGCAWTVAPGQHHFDVIEGLENPRSALIETCLGGL